MTTQHYCISTTATTIRFSWSKRFIEEENIIGEIDGFDIKYRDSKEGRWYNKHVSNENETFKLEIDRLKSNHVYDINITWQDKDADSHPFFKGSYKTNETKANILKESAVPKKEREPFLCKLTPVKFDYLRVKSGACVDQIRFCDMIAEYKPSKYESSDEKTLLLLGPTGTGKSTFIDALLNYIKGVSYRNNYRYTLINETKEEKERSDQKSQSQTSSVTVYRIPTIDGGQVSHKVNIIDTPGFNDTRENFDERITQQIRELFEIRRGKHSVIHLDAILVVVPLSTQRLTHQLKEVFSNILHMFGKDIAKNIFAVITFDDGGEETCLSVLRDAKIPINGVFKFNNANVLTEFKTHGNSESMHLEQWRNRTMSFRKLFEKLEITQGVTVESSVHVMHTRTNLQLRLESLKDKVAEQAQNIVNYKKDKYILLKIEHESPENKAKAVYHEMEPIMQEQYFGKRSFNCNVCRKTCHKNCWVPFDLLKRTCEVIEDKKCTVCQGKCGLSNHSLSEYVFVQQYVKSWYSGKDVISRQKKRETIFSRFQETLAETGDLIKDLNDNALEPDVLTLSEYIENIITKEEDENKIDFQMRVQILKKVLEHLKKERSVRGLKMEDLS